MAVPDLLRQRRVELGLTAAPPPLRPAWVVLGMGAGIGTVVVLIVLIVYWQLLNRERALQQTVARLTPLEQRLAKARSRLQKATTSAAKLEQDTAKITAQLVSLRSGSAFLEQLRRVTPGGGKLQSVAVQPDQLSISGLAEPSSVAGGLEQINAFALNLESLAAVPIDGAAIQKAETSSAASTAFSLRVRVDPAIKPTPQQLRDLGALGLAARFELLKQKGLPL
ncbi:fimbrial assembly family protein [Synechococcus sp. BOUM118]|nr:fimbrial assembly family protein [Synechococcus sp. BOUM118]